MHHNIFFVVVKTLTRNINGAIINIEKTESRSVDFMKISSIIYSLLFSERIIAKFSYNININIVILKLILICYSYKGVKKGQ